MEKTYQSASRLFSDSHRTFKPFTESRREDETERQYDRRMWQIYCDLVREKERPESGNRVYMNYLDDYFED
jgi:hypothetical protein